MIHDFLADEYQLAFDHALTCLIDVAKTFAGVDEREGPRRRIHFPEWSNALGQLNLAARRLWSVVQEYSPFGLQTPSVDEPFLPVVNAALESARTYFRAMDLFDGRMDSPGFLDADEVASEAMLVLIDRAREAFGVEA